MKRDAELVCDGNEWIWIVRFGLYIYKCVWKQNREKD